MVHAGELSESSEQFIFELSALIMVEFGRVPEPRDKVIKNPVSSCFAGLVFGRVCLGKPGKVVDHHQDILVSPTAGLGWRKSIQTSLRGELDVILPIGARSCAAGFFCLIQ